MSVISSFYYEEQLKKYIAQFMAVFAGINVRVGWLNDTEPRLVSVPIAYASKDRVVADIKSENVSENKPIRLPMFSAYLTSLDLAPELRKGVGGERRNTFMPTGGLFPDDMNVVHQLMPVPYRATMELGIYSSNTDQHFQILEQILTVFDPIIQIQTNDEVFDWTKISTIELVDIRNEENFPAGPDRRIIQHTLAFQFQIYLSAPANVRKDFIRDIYLRIGTIATHDCNLRPSTWGSQNVLDELDITGAQTIHLFSLDDFTEEDISGPDEEGSLCDD